MERIMEEKQLTDLIKDLEDMKAHAIAFAEMAESLAEDFFKTHDHGWDINDWRMDIFARNYPFGGEDYQEVNFRISEWAYGMRDLGERTDPLHDEAGEIIEAAIKELNDPNVYYMLLESVDPNTEIHLTHPTASSYVARGEAIIEKIEELTGWH